MGRLMQNPDVAQAVLAKGWASAEELEAMRAEVLEWGERPDAFAAVLYCAALGWVDGETPSARKAWGRVLRSPHLVGGPRRAEVRAAGDTVGTNTPFLEPS
jgi:hypothetical protein